MAKDKAQSFRREIKFPNGGLYDSAFGPQNVGFLGRNGPGKCLGIEVYSDRLGYVALSPITSRGEVGRCRIEISDDEATVLDLINALCTVIGAEPRVKAKKAAKG